MRKILGFGAVAILLAGLTVGYLYWKRVLAVNTNMKRNETRVLFIPTGATFEEVVDSLNSGDIVKNLKTFRWVADKKNYPELVKAGRYELRGHMTNNELVNQLRAGDQQALHVTLNNISGIYQLAGVLGDKLEPDSLSFLNLFKSEESLSAFGVDPYTLTAYFLPNTYEVWWNTSPAAFLKRMRREFDEFWTEERRLKAAELGLTPIEVVTLASIVESETVKKDEQPRVAGLYLNRLKKNMRLQSDPTVIYAIKLDQPQVQIKRVLNRHLTYDSKFNTYKYAGLPPGPIRIPELTAIDAVLNHENHSFIFMAADPSRPGYHNFATNLRQHNINARKYQNWANRNGL